MTKVIILGGGVAGMSAAHELIERGFEVEVYERQSEYVGGKARSVNVPNTNLLFEDKYLPGEHGFRFFAGFYKHVIDTMKRIPQRIENGVNSKETCFDNLVDAESIMIARYGNKEPIEFPADFFGSWVNFKKIYKLFRNRETILGLQPGEIEFFRDKMFQIMCSCDERRSIEYEKISWWDFMDADNKSQEYQNLLVIGVTRTLVAANAKHASTKSDGNIILQLVYDFINPFIRTDRLFNAPTNEAWLNPWLAYLKSKGVKYQGYHKLIGFNMTDDGKIESANVKGLWEGEPDLTISGDYYIMAVPADRAADCISDGMIAVDEGLKNISVLADTSMSWMVGIQFYLNVEVNINPGHVNYADTAWALTSVDQMKFWKDYDLHSRYNGQVKSILSVDISNWDDVHYYGDPAHESGREEIKDLVWDQLELSLNKDGKIILDKSMIMHYYIDNDIIIYENRDSANKEKMLVNIVDSWDLRPEAVTKIPNFFLASDYVKTHTDLATMEAANEAARRAVNGIIDASGSTATKCKIWELEEPPLLNPIKWYDKRRYLKNPKSAVIFPFWLKVVMVFWGLLCVAYFVILFIIFKIQGKKPT